jgi:hypothetical protein
VQGSYRTAWVVGSFQFYKFYRVFSPYEEIPRAIEMMLHDLNVEVCNQTDQDPFWLFQSFYIQLGADLRSLVLFWVLGNYPPIFAVAGDRVSFLFSLVQMKDWDGVVRAFYTYHAFVHYIHPFADGNGRLSRLLANIVLKSAGYLGVLTYQVRPTVLCLNCGRVRYSLQF